MTTITIKRTMHNPTAFLGKRIDETKWIITDARYQVCRMTYKLFDTAAGDPSFGHYHFEKQFLLDNGIYVEDAEYLSLEGFAQIQQALEDLGLWDQYIEEDAWPTDRPKFGWADVTRGASASRTFQFAA